MRILPLCLVLSLAAGAGLPCSAAGSDYEQSFGVEATALFNVKVSAALHDPATVTPAASAGVARTYLDGFNRPDSSGDLGEGLPGLPSRTGYWGYSSASQLDSTAGTLAMHLLQTSAAPYLSRNESSSRTGWGLRYQVLRRSASVKFGLEVRLSRLDFSQSNTGTLGVPLTLLSDTYALGGVIPPAAPYSGKYAVVPFTPRIGDLPTRTLSAVSGLAQGSRQFAYRGWLARLGAVVRPIDTPRFSAELHGGPALVWGSGSFALAEVISSGTLPILAESAGGSRNKTLLGAYAGGLVRWTFRPHYALTGSVDVVDAGHCTIGTANATARIGLQQAYLVSLGVERSF